MKGPLHAAASRAIIASALPAPSLDLDFLSGSLDPRITFTRTGSGSYFDAAGVLQTASSNVPRFDHDPVTHAARGLLIEEQRTNLQRYSEDFSQWEKTNINVTSATDSFKLAPISPVTNSYITLAATSASVPDNSTVAVYCDVKAGELNYFYLQGKTKANSYPAVRFNLTDKTTQITSSGGTGANLTASCFAVDEGFLRCVITFNVLTGSQVTLNTFIVFTDANSTLLVSSADGTKGGYIRRSQFEIGSFPTSYIPTASSAVTRAADVAVMTGTNFSPWFNLSQGSIVAEFESRDLPVPAGRRVFELNNGTSANRIGVMQNGLFYVGGTPLTVDMTVSGVSASGINKIACGYALDNFAIASASGSIANDASGALPTVISQMNIGDDPSLSSGGSINGWLRRITCYPRRPPDTVLLALAK